jgi:hypothetical protein
MTDTGTVSGWPSERRLAMLHELSSDVLWHYTGRGITVSVARGGFGASEAWARRHGLTNASMWYFPLGSDKPSDAMRHDGNYPGSRGFWLFVYYVPLDTGTETPVLPELADQGVNPVIPFCDHCHREGHLIAECPDVDPEWFELEDYRGC